MRRFVLTSIPHHRQRYETVGDWQDGHGFTLITVSETGNDDYDVLVAVHELIEYLLCKKRGISPAEVDAFDINFEAARTRGEVSGEPGDDPKAPYRHEHRFAENVERLLAHELGVVWSEYEAALSKL